VTGLGIIPPQRLFLASIPNCNTSLKNQSQQETAAMHIKEQLEFILDGGNTLMSDEYRSNYGLENHGFTNLEREYWNLSTPALYEQAIRHREGVMGHLGALVVRTGDHTGRSPNDKFIVREPSSEDKIWWGVVNRDCTEENFENTHRRMMAYFQNRSVFVQDMYAGTAPNYRIPIRVITEQAWHSMFACLIPTNCELMYPTLW
jgi:ATP-dependent phosphoenolpyruvate carboxykinase